MKLATRGRGEEEEGGQTQQTRGSRLDRDTSEARSRADAQGSGERSAAKEQTWAGGTSAPAAA